LNDNFFEIVEMPEKYFSLIHADIIGEVNESDVTDKNNKHERLWISFGRWLSFKEPIKREQIRQHLRLKWRKLRHLLNIQDNKDFQDISGVNIPNNQQKNQLILSARNNFRSTSGLHYISKSICVTDVDNRTLIHLGNLDDQNAVAQAASAVNKYYFHTLNEPSH
jgi:hypothetical protein